MSFWSDLLGVTGTTFKIGKAKATLDASGLTAARTLTLPDQDGTVAVLSDIASPGAIAAATAFAAAYG